MNRCICAPWGSSELRTAPPRTWARVRISLALLAACVLSASLGAQPAPRPFPPAALRGLLQITQPPEALLNGEPARLAPGARIFSPQQTLLLSAGLVGQTLVVNYTRDTYGLLHQVWLLTEAEAALPRAGWQGSNIRFESQIDPAPDAPAPAGLAR